MLIIFPVEFLGEGQMEGTGGREGVGRGQEGGGGGGRRGRGGGVPIHGTVAIALS